MFVRHPRPNSSMEMVLAWRRETIDRLAAIYGEEKFELAREFLNEGKLYALDQELTRIGHPP